MEPVDSTYFSFSQLSPPDVAGGAHGLRSPGLMSGGTLPCDISHDAFDVTYHHPPPPSTGVSTLDVCQPEYYNHKILDLE